MKTEFNSKQIIFNSVILVLMLVIENEDNLKVLIDPRWYLYFSIFVSSANIVLRYMTNQPIQSILKNAGSK